MTFESFTKKREVICGTYLVTDRSYCIHHPLEEVIAQSIKGGVKMVQLREKDISTRDFLDLAIRLKNLLVKTNVPLIINDRLDIALAAGAEGLHLGQTDLPATYARKILGEEAIIGLSIESMDDFYQLPAQANLDYLGISPIFSTQTKLDTKEPWGLDGLKRIRSMTQLPLVAIGGINEKNAKSVIEAGADSLAVVSYLCSAESPFDRAKYLTNLYSKL
ncbi:thiamine phosphate synthase [Leptospira idonii]|uniref:Thiamine-phosphate synthase n=1 Tax=Leptospira idonii TaxID=1193500 RepID=A0A4V3JYG1_9LEPT|nr:thiamine phosphate synthase [Leptospira idonii]TGN20976.1 thiamine phosphate synthase [Leptospira idonii]